MHMDHRERQRWVDEIAAINTRLNSMEEEWAHHLSPERRKKELLRHLLRTRRRRLSSGRRVPPPRKRSPTGFMTSSVRTCDWAASEGVPSGLECLCRGTVMWGGFTKPPLSPRTVQWQDGKPALRCLVRRFRSRRLVAGWETCPTVLVREVHSRQLVAGAGAVDGFWERIGAAWMCAARLNPFSLCVLCVFVVETEQVLERGAYAPNRTKG